MKVADEPDAEEDVVGAVGLTLLRPRDLISNILSRRSMKAYNVVHGHTKKFDLV